LPDGEFAKAADQEVVATGEGALDDFQDRMNYPAASYGVSIADAPGLERSKLRRMNPVEIQGNETIRS